MRRLCTHIRALPRESQIALRANGGVPPWSDEKELLASIFDAVNNDTYVYLRANGNSPTEPARWPRPNTERKPEPPKGMSLAELPAVLAQMTF